ncbi:MAG: TIGR01777 family oxidoreductase [Sulfurospirillaceae bacterium]|nr:TIGR01777 family oxidoreductase [Sulfurospirillaceae bacterium]MDD2827144.1 TIGR01777 family oxidoreductase [Sulfurospirillaceae bacterium]
MKVAMSGASGFVANALKKAFPEWIAIDRTDSVEAIVVKLQGVDAVFNLAGAPIAARWDEAYKKVLLSSRIDTTKKLVAAINQSDVKHFISTSAVGIYPNNIPCDEESEKMGDDFLAGLALAWESEARKCQKPTTILRFGVVLGKDGGALEKMVPAIQAYMGGTIGNGMMITSWIDIDDLVRIYQFVLDNNTVGTFNATAPNPVSNFTFTKILGKILKRPTWLPLPPFIIKMLFSEGATVLLDSKEVYPKALVKKGFSFKYPDLEGSLRKILA